MNNIAYSQSSVSKGAKLVLKGAADAVLCPSKLMTKDCRTRLRISAHFDQTIGKRVPERMKRVLGVSRRPDFVRNKLSVLDA